jgi:hypothetical protein
MSNRTPPSMTIATSATNETTSSSSSIGGQLRKNRKSLFDTDAAGDGSSGNAVTNSAVKLFANVGRARNKHNQQHTRYAYTHSQVSYAFTGLSSLHFQTFSCATGAR